MIWLPARLRFTALGAALVLGLASRGLAQTDSQRAVWTSAIAEGDAAWTGGRFPLAKTAYIRAVGIDSSRRSSRAVYRLAVLRSWDNNLDAAIPLFKLYVSLEPRDEEGRIALAKAYGWHGAFKLAVLTYDSVLAIDHTYRDAALGAAQTLAWAGQFDSSMVRFDHWLVQNPRDVEAALGRARTLAWAGRLKESERAYTEISARGEQLEATKGVALVSAWRGDLGRSERLWRSLTGIVPNDPEVWVGLAQVLRWRGRAEDARTALYRALVLEPSHRDARDQMRWVRADLGSTVEPMALASWDSDQNRSLLFGVSGSTRPLSQTRLTVSTSYRTAELGALTGTSIGGRASLRVHAGRYLSFTGDVGDVRTHGKQGAATSDLNTTVGGFRMTISPWTGFSIGGGVARSVFDETAQIIQSGIRTTSWSGESELSLPGRLVLFTGGEVGNFEGGSIDNRRRSGYATLRWRARRQTWFAVGGRSFGYDESPRDGYFAPSRFAVAEASSRLAWGRDLGWAFAVEGGVGLQQIEFDNPALTHGAQRIGASLAYRPRPGTEFVLDYGFSNVSGNGAGSVASGTSVYHANVLSLRSRLTW